VAGEPWWIYRMPPSVDCACDEPTWPVPLRRQGCWAAPFSWRHLDALRLRFCGLRRCRSMSPPAGDVDAVESEVCAGTLHWASMGVSLLPGGTGARTPIELIERLCSKVLKPPVSPLLETTGRAEARWCCVDGSGKVLDDSDPQGEFRAHWLA